MTEPRERALKQEKRPKKNLVQEYIPDYISEYFNAINGEKN